MPEFKHRFWRFEWLLYEGDTYSYCATIDGKLWKIWEWLENEAALGWELQEWKAPDKHNIVLYMTKSVVTDNDD